MCGTSRRRVGGIGKLGARVDTLRNCEIGSGPLPRLILKIVLQCSNTCRSDNHLRLLHMAPLGILYVLSTSTTPLTPNLAQSLQTFVNLIARLRPHSKQKDVQLVRERERRQEEQMVCNYDCDDGGPHLGSQLPSFQIAEWKHRIISFREWRRS
jgi:hypothetical protein